MFSYLPIALIALHVALASHMVKAQDLLVELDHIRARVQRVVSSGSGLVEIEGPIQPGDTLFADLFDCRNHAKALHLLKQLECKFIIDLASPTADLRLGPFVDVLTDIKELDTLVLDSIDVEPEDYVRLLKGSPGTRLIVSERTAIRRINEIYGFAFDHLNGHASSISVTEKRRPIGLEFLDEAHFAIANRFVGVRWYPIWLEPIPRRSLPYFRHLQVMRHLDLGQVGVADDDLRYFSRMSQLEHLNLEGAKIRGSGLLYIPAENLTYLSLYKASGLEEIPFEHFHSLEYLVMAESDLPASEYARLSKCPNLRTLRASGSSLKAPDIDELLAMLPNLEFFEINYDNIPKDDPELARLRSKYRHIRIGLLERDEGPAEFRDR